MALNRTNAKQLLEAGYITQEAYNKMFEDGLIKESSAASRPQINVPADFKAEFTEKAYNAMVEIAKELGFDYEKPSNGSGVATLYLKGSGVKRETSNDGGELTAESLD